MRRERIAVTCYGGSNVSLEDAKKNAREKVELIKRKVAGEDEKKAPKDYEVEIREEIVETLSTSCVVTRNAYGALVLNSADTMFIDIDAPRWSIFNLFANQDAAWRKNKIIKMIRKHAASPQYRKMAFRVYETSHGIRVIVIGRKFFARSKEAEKIMRDFNADRLYRVLCNKQNCFRARLTPKPARVRYHRPGSRYPRETEEENIEFKRWLAEYQEKAERYAVCRYVESVGGDFPDNIVKYHDRITKATSQLKLA